MGDVVMDLNTREGLEAHRQELRERFPGATWLTGDPCPVDKKIRRRSDGTTGRVLGPFEPLVEKRHNCPDCRCKPRADPMRYMWRIALDAPWADVFGKPLGDEKSPVLCWPSELEPE